MDQESSAKVKQYRVKLAKVTAIIERIKEGQQLDVKLSLEELITLQSELKQMLQIEAKKTEAPKEEEEEKEEEKEEQKEEEKQEEQDIKMAAMRICCGLYQAENKWYGAIVNGQNEKQNTVEVTWLGINEPASLPYRHVELSKIPDAKDLKPGIECECLFFDDGLWYSCLIISQDKPVVSATGVEVNFYEVEFQNSSFKTRVPINFLRLEGERAKASVDEDSKKGKMLGKRSKGGEDEDEFEEEYTGDTDKFVIPQHLKLQAGDSQAEKEAKKRKKKALKWKFLQKQQEKVQTQRKSAWSQFLNKAEKNRKGYFSKSKGDSIFKSPDNIMGRVGVTGSGKGVTVTVMKKHKFEQIEEEEN